MWTSRRAWLAAAPEVVADVGLAVAALPSWHRAVTAIEAPDAVDLRDPLARGRITLADRHGQVPGTWRVRRRVRDTVHLEVVTDLGAAIELLVSCSPWDGGTAVELGIERADARGWVAAWDAARRLDASLIALQRRTSGTRPPVRPAPVARTRPVATSG